MKIMRYRDKVSIQFFDLFNALDELPDRNDTLLMIMQFMEDLSILMTDISDNIVINSDNVKLDEYITALMNETLISINNNTNLTLDNIKDITYGL